MRRKRKPVRLQKEIIRAKKKKGRRKRVCKREYGYEAGDR
jgi:hypothetical protein